MERMRGGKGGWGEEEEEGEGIGESEGREEEGGGGEGDKGTGREEGKGRKEGRGRGVGYKRGIAEKRGEGMNAARPGVVYELSICKSLTPVLFDKFIAVLNYGVLVCKSGSHADMHCDIFIIVFIFHE